jgi:hypothetical protein
MEKTVVQARSYNGFERLELLTTPVGIRVEAYFDPL